MSDTGPARTIQLSQFGYEYLTVAEVTCAQQTGNEVEVTFEAASLNPRDAQIIAGQFTQDVSFPLVPLSDGAGVVTAVGPSVTQLAPGEKVTPLFFPNWQQGEATAGERAVSSGLETPGTAREKGLYAETALVKHPSHLLPAEAACYPCAGLTAWTALFDKSNIKEGDWVLIQGTGGVATMGIQLAKAAGANVIVISSSEEKLEQAAAIGADHLINYVDVSDWGARAFELSGSGVDAVLEIGGTGTLENSLAAIRHGGHINIIGYMAGIDMGITVFPLIIKNANFHGIGTGHRKNYEALMQFVETHQLHPVISHRFALEEIQEAFHVLNTGRPFGKVVLEFGG